ncbi:HAD family hydrolase, partial [Deinococcus sp. UYEF24]
MKGNPMKFRHVIWDLDGTLLDTYPATDGALAVALSGLGYQVTPEALRPLIRIPKNSLYFFHQTPYFPPSSRRLLGSLQAQ